MRAKSKKPAALGKGQAGSNIDFDTNHTKKKSKKTSLRKRINLMCKSCIYDPQEPGTWRLQVACCTSSNCPLFDVRPLQKGANSASKTDESDEIEGEAA